VVAEKEHQEHQVPQEQMAQTAQMLFGITLENTAVAQHMLLEI
jgi:hypothetical protein